jgi:phospholipase/carboxylesterase
VTPDAAAALDAIGALLPPLLGAFEAVEWTQRHLHPAVAARLAEPLSRSGAALTGPVSALEALPCPGEIGFMRDRLLDVARRTVELCDAFAEAARSPGDVVGLYRALRRFAGAQEALYPLAPVLDPVSRWFLDPARRGDEALLTELRAAALRDDGVRTGVLHAGNERGDRGGFSLFVPEAWDGSAPTPLVVALHGGHGHGRDFLWSWVREARTRGVLLLAPTSADRTWSLMGDDVDAEALDRMLETVAARYPVDRGRVLLTGMSDGATYALLCGLRAGAPFTHLAPACGVLHPFLLANGGLDRARGRPIYLVHGALDWMFPVGVARQAREILADAGAQVVYRELDDLAHAYPRDENTRMLDWLLAA